MPVQAGIAGDDEVTAGGPTRPVSPRRRTSAPRIAWTLAALSFAVTGVAVWIAIWNRHYVDAVGAVAYLAFPIVGLLIALKRPRNAIGWIFLVNGLLTNLAVFTRNYAERAVFQQTGWPVVHLLAWVDQWLWVPGIGLLLIYGLLLFPDGSPPSDRWRWIIPTAAAAIATFVTALGYFAWGFSDRILVGNVRPSASSPAARIALGVGDVSLVVALVCAVAAAASLVARYRRGRGVERQQVKWVAAAGALAVLLEAATSWFPSVGAVAESAGFALIAVAAGVAIMRYHLYDIDRIVSRTVCYALVTGLLIGVYVGSVALLTDVLPFRGDIGTAASVLVAVALFAPLRGRVQAIVDRRFNRSRYDAERVIQQFAHRLRDEVDLNILRQDLLGVVERTVAPEWAALWIREAR